MKPEKVKELCLREAAIKRLTFAMQQHKESNIVLQPIALEADDVHGHSHKCIFAPAYNLPNVDNIHWRNTV